MKKISAGLDFAWQLAVVEAAYGKYEFIEPEHLFVGACKFGSLAEIDVPLELQTPKPLAGLLKAEAEAVVALFSKFDLNYVELYRELRIRKGQGNFRGAERSTVSRSDASKAIFARAEELSTTSRSVTTLHLIAALLDDNSTIAALLQENGVADMAAMHAAALSISIPFPGNRDSKTETQNLGIAASQVLLRYGKDLTQLARDGLINECVGRREELLRVVQTLNRDTKNNPLLIGEAGVGKTAIVEGLAWRIARDKDKAMVGRRIIQLDVSRLVAGTKYRGEFEERLTALVQVIAEDPNVIVFIDEIHTIIGAGNSAGRLDAANILKPALARGELRCIGATTLAEYRNEIEKDSALERRFQPIMVHEPSIEETEQILSVGYVKRFEERRGVVIEPSAVHTAVVLAARYLPNRRLPDKAIDLLDEACSRVAVPILSALPGEQQDVWAAAVVSGATVAEVLSKWTEIPVTRMAQNERDQLLNMEAELKSRVVGQDEACKRVAQLVQRARAGLKAPGRPIGVLLFIGPSGVGKTQLAKATAAFLFANEKALVRLDMSEFAERHSVSRLIGAPPGYIGHDEEGQLTGALRQRPYCVVLLDEIEKANPEVLNLFLQVFEEGQLTDSKGRTADATNALFIMTSNAVLQLGAVSPGNQPLRDVREIFQPEFINRIDDIIDFGPLTHAHLKSIALLLIADLEKRLATQDIGLEVKDAAVQWILEHAHSETGSARHLRRAIEQHIENQIASGVLREQIRSGHVVIVDNQEEALVFTLSSMETLF